MIETTKILFLILLAPGAILAISLHEAMHGFVANRLGDPTAKMLGRLSLNPFKHIDPIGTILVPALLYLFGGMMFGWAKPVPVSIRNLNNPKRDMALVAVAGPGANLSLAVIASLFLYLIAALISAVHFNETVSQTVFFPLIMILFFMIKFNLFLMMFNLIPIPPLDGGRILVGLLPYRQAAAVAAIEPFGFFIVIGLLMIDRAIPLFSYLMLPVRFLETLMVPDLLRPLLGG
ncbi:MAG: site-2 protease family protein [Myxococcales bacterium]|nr:site-2 protease family protein [Myxococcales bacterium]